MKNIITELRLLLRRHGHFLPKHGTVHDEARDVLGQALRRQTEHYTREAEFGTGPLPDEAHKEGEWYRNHEQ